MLIRAGWALALCSWSVLFFAAASAGCRAISSAHTASRNYSLGHAPVDPPMVHDASYEQCLTGGRVFKMYCSSCHNARPLGERPFANYEVAATHMREQAYLTGAEYRALIHFLRRWHDVGPPTPEAVPPPKRFEFSQPIPDLRPNPQELEDGREVEGTALKNDQHL
jgi:hypothetical protein